MPPNHQNTGTDDVFVPEVLVDVVDNYLRTNSALLTMGLAVDATGDIEWARGGRHITRPEFLGGLTAGRLVPGQPRDRQKVRYVDVRYPVIDSIIPFGIEGVALDDLFDNEGFFNRLSRHVNEVVLEDLDRNLISYTVDIGDGEKDYGALGTDLVLDLTADVGIKTLHYDALVIARGLFGDNPGPLVVLAHSKCMTDLLLTTEAKDMQKGIALGNQSGVLFPALNMIAIQTDRVPVATQNAVTVYHNLVCKPGCVSYAWRRQMTVNPLYLGNNEWQYAFVWRTAQMRNKMNSREMVVKLTTVSNRDVTAPVA